MRSSEEESDSAKTGIAPEWRQPIFPLVHLVPLVYPVSLVQSNKQDKLNKPDRPNGPNKQDRLADFSSILLDVDEE
jgi:hypothetical protein